MKNSSGLTLQFAMSSAELARNILRRIFENFGGNVLIRLWDGYELRMGRLQMSKSRPQLLLTFDSPETFRTLFLSRNPLYFLESYFEGRVNIEGDLYSVLSLRHNLTSLHLSPMEKAILLIKLLGIESHKKLASGTDTIMRWDKTLAQKLRLGSSKSLNRHSISFHYDVSNEFYALWLDKQMIYSCAYFEDAGQSLEQAQCNKLNHICRKLRLQPGEHLLDIGCGWGALICWAAEHYGVNAHGITLSRNQFQHVQNLIRERGLEGKVSVELLDYRDLKGEARYDKLVSVGMFEHVGLKNLPAYFAIAHRMLKPGGLFLNHGITTDEGGWKKDLSSEFINRYVFPDGQLETVSTVQGIMEDTSFEIHDVEGLRSHYALTLREWVKRLEEKHDDALNYVSEATYRVWRLYMAACALQFEEGTTGIYQILASRRQPFSNPVPLTRKDIYS
jgi:cyclopropane-fatty-acyl-phospholipid synthase